MNKKLSIISYVLSVLVFAAGAVMVHLNAGLLGVIGFIGYVLTSIAVFIVICTAAVNIVLRREMKKDGKRK